MKQEKKFLRRCVSCREYKSKDELIRITKDYVTKEIKINNDSKIQGRSVYICKNEHCLEMAIKKKKIENSLKTCIPNSVKEELYTVLKK